MCVCVCVCVCVGVGVGVGGGIVTWLHNVGLENNKHYWCAFLLKWQCLLSCKTTPRRQENTQEQEGSALWWGYTQWGNY